MTNAAVALQTAVVSRLDERSSLSGVFFDAPARATFPYAVVACTDERDWSSIGCRGREISMQVALWDEQPSRLLDIESDVETLLQGTRTAIPWHLSSMVVIGKQRACKPGHPWSLSIELRCRLIEDISGVMA